VEKKPTSIGLVNILIKSISGLVFVFPPMTATMMWQRVGEAAAAVAAADTHLVMTMAMMLVEVIMMMRIVASCRFLCVNLSSTVA
jgi:hypothetical protein